MGIQAYLAQYKSFSEKLTNLVKIAEQLELDDGSEEVLSPMVDAVLADLDG